MSIPIITNYIFYVGDIVSVIVVPGPRGHGNFKGGWVVPNASSLALLAFFVFLSSVVLRKNVAIIFITCVECVIAKILQNLFAF